MLAPLLMIVVAILPIPAELPPMLNGMIFGPLIGTTITWLGAIVGAWISCELARRFGRPLTERFVKSTLLERTDRVVDSAGWPGLLTVRLIPAVAFTALNWGAGLTTVPRWTFLWTTTLGTYPGPSCSPCPAPGWQPSSGQTQQLWVSASWFFWSPGGWSCATGAGQAREDGRAVALSRFGCEVGEVPLHPTSDCRGSRMKRGALIAIVAHMAAVGMMAGQAQGRQQQPRITAFVNVNVIPMDEERVLRNYTVVVEQGRIMEMGPAGSVTVPANAQRIDGSGKYLMPGLAEMHGHTPSGPFAETVMFLYVANGVTTVRGMLGLEGNLELRRRASTGQIIAPTLYLAGPSFNNRTVSSVQHAIDRVRLQKAQGWDHLKIHPGLTVEQYDAVARTASQVGIRFGGHVPADVGIIHAIEMGQLTFDHLDGYLQYAGGIDGPIDEGILAEAVELTKQAGAAVVPTMVLWEVGIIGLGDIDEMENYPEMRYWPRQQVRSWATRVRQRPAGF